MLATKVKSHPIFLLVALFVFLIALLLFHHFSVLVALHSISSNCAHHVSHSISQQLDMTPPTLSCNSRSNANGTHFVNPGYPKPFNGSTSCQITIDKIKSVKICQLRVDFEEFDLQHPVDGDCMQDKFIVSGQNGNSIIPIICGRNTWQHMYIDVDASEGPIVLEVITSSSSEIFPKKRRWDIRVSQIECDNPSRPPQNCLQYFTGHAGVIQSFNYEPPRELSESITPQTMLSRESSYLNNMDYAICFRKEKGFCTQTYAVNSSIMPLEISAYNPSGSLIFDSIRYGGAGPGKCQFDYLTLGGVRYCGARLSSTAVLSNTDMDTPIFDRSSGPFIARFVSNAKYVGRGFRITYHQNPCGARLPLDCVGNNLNC